MVLLWKFVIQLIFVANSPPHPDGQELDHPARGRNCPLEISNSAPVEDTGRGKERDEWLRKKGSEREGGRVTKMTGWGRRKRWPDAALAKHHIGPWPWHWFCSSVHLYVLPQITVGREDA